MSQTCTGDMYTWLSARHCGWGQGREGPQRKANARFGSSAPGRQRAYCKHSTRGKYQNRSELESHAGPRAGEVGLAGASVAAEVEMEQNAGKDGGHAGRRDWHWKGERGRGPKRLDLKRAEEAPRSIQKLRGETCDEK